VPSSGEDTTLVVSDIMESTALWETLAPGVMECAVATHNTVVRQAVGRWNGYEQATEGDSFLLAFHNPSDALGFAMQLQASLLEAAWEPELLQHPLCAPMKMGPSAALQSAGDSDGRFALLRAGQILAPSDRILLSRSEGHLLSRGSYTASGDAGCWDDAQTVLALPDSYSTLGAAGSAVQSHAKARRSSVVMRDATAAAVLLDDRSSSSPDSLLAHGGGVFAAEATMADSARTSHLDRARDRLQSMHAAATGDGLRTIGSFQSFNSSTSHGDAPVTSTMAKFMQLAWNSAEGSFLDEAMVKNQATVFKVRAITGAPYSNNVHDTANCNT
jgi:hypothetical protein